jgi:hypothetical protein
VVAVAVEVVVDVVVVVDDDVVVNDVVDHVVHGLWTWDLGVSTRDIEV